MKLKREDSRLTSSAKNDFIETFKTFPGHHCNHGLFLIGDDGNIVIKADGPDSIKMKKKSILLVQPTIPSPTLV